MELTAAQRIRAEAKDATRGALLRAGLAATIESGGVVPSMEAICSGAGFSRGAFYAHFQSRSDFVAQMLEWVVGDFHAAIFNDAGRGSIDLRSVINRFVRVLVEGTWPHVGDIRSAYLIVLAGLRQSDGVRSRHADLMRSAMDRLELLVRLEREIGRVREKAEPRKVAELLCLLSVGSMVWVDAGLPLDAEGLTESLLALLEVNGSGLIADSPG